MKIEEEKKLVAEKLMGWEVHVIHSEHHKIYATNPNRVFEDSQFWKPESDRNCWDEIWEKMDDGNNGEFIDNFTNNIEEVFPRSLLMGDWDYLTVKPELCWKALIKTLEAL